MLCLNLSFLSMITTLFYIFNFSLPSICLGMFYIFPLTKKGLSQLLKSPKSAVRVLSFLPIVFYLCSCSGQGMLPTEESFFKNGKVNKEALVDFIKTIKKNTNLSDEDAAIMAASKVCQFFVPFSLNAIHWNV